MLTPGYRRAVCRACRLVSHLHDLLVSETWTRSRAARLHRPRPGRVVRRDGRGAVAGEGRVVPLSRPPSKRRPTTAFPPCWMAMSWQYGITPVECSQAGDVDESSGQGTVSTAGFDTFDDRAGGLLPGTA